MKHLKTILLATALSIGTISFSGAQSKIAHINTQELIQAMPAMEQAKAQLETLSKTYQTELQALGAEFQKKVQLYDSEAATKTKEENTNRAKEVQTMEQSIREYQQKAQQDLQKKEFDLLKPITDDAKAAILKVARAQGFDYVLDSSQGVTIMADGKNLLDDVKKSLGI
ncbi:OmpH family outer membrane protein [Algibacter sp. 2305UL17-15]|uniref:OmpH family outer membrane protein n=1 Tax=Algibacter sp. 2305UL17-15 TaxID=3231268 RepID=UPI0034577717